MSEGTFYRSYTTYHWSPTWWQESVDMTVWIQDNFLSGNNNRQLVACVPVGNPPIPGGMTKMDLAMFGFCSLMLGVKYSAQNNIYFGKLGNEPALLSLAQQLRKLNLGSPIGAYYTFDSGSLYVRDFENGKVIVNQSDSPYAYVLDNSYKVINGTTVSGSLLVYAKSGVILYK